MPTPLDAPGDGLDEFRISEPHELAAMLRRLADGDVPITLGGEGGPGVAATLWSVDPARGTLGFAVEPDDPGLASLVESRRVVATGYLDAVKVQFDVALPVLVRGPRSCAIACDHPEALYRFQRRGAYRVRPLPRTTPTACLRHTDIAEMRLELRVLDVSIGGCALFLPSDVPPMQVGGVAGHVAVELDDETRLVVDLRLQNVVSLGTELRGVRLGCEFVRPDATTQRHLQRFIDRAQKRARLLTPD